MVPGFIGGRDLIEILRRELPDFHIEPASNDASPADIGRLAESLTSKEGSILVLALDDRRPFPTEKDRVEFWRRLNYQRERLASDGLRTCLILDPENDQALAQVADDLAEWVIEFRFPLAYPVPARLPERSHLRGTSFGSLIGPGPTEEDLAAKRSRLAEARALGLPEVELVKSYAIPLFVDLIRGSRQEEAFKIWERELREGSVFAPTADLELLELTMLIQSALRLTVEGPGSPSSEKLREWVHPLAKQLERVLLEARLSRGTNSNEEGLVRGYWQMELLCLRTDLAKLNIALGDSQSSQDYAEQALSGFCELGSVDPDLAVSTIPTIHRLWELLVQLGKLEHSREILECWFELSPQASSTVLAQASLYSLVFFLGVTGRSDYPIGPKLATRLLEEMDRDAYQVDPLTRSLVLIIRGRLKLVLGKPHEALRDLDRSLESSELPTSSPERAWWMEQLRVIASTSKSRALEALASSETP